MNSSKVQKFFLISTLIIFSLLTILNLVVFLRLGESNDFFKLTVENYKTLYVARVVYQIFLLVFSFVAIYFVVNYENFKKDQKVVIILACVLIQFPIIFTAMLFPVFQKGVNVSKVYDIEITSEKIVMRSRFTQRTSYKKYIFVEGKRFFLDDSLYENISLADCPDKKFVDNLEWDFTCESSFKIYYLDMENGLIKIERF